MNIRLAMGFELVFDLSPELEASFKVPVDLIPFWRAIEPFLCVILTHHPNREPDEPLELLWQFRLYMLSVPKMKDSWKRWRTAEDVAAQRPGRNLPRWTQYDPPEERMPYVTWFLLRFSQYITRIGFEFE